MNVDFDEARRLRNEEGWSIQAAIKYVTMLAYRQAVEEAKTVDDLKDVLRDLITRVM